MGYFSVFDWETGMKWRNLKREGGKWSLELVLANWELGNWRAGELEKREGGAGIGLWETGTGSQKLGIQ